MAFLQLRHANAFCRADPPRLALHPNIRGRSTQSMRALHYLGMEGIAWRDIAPPVVNEATDAIVRPLAVAACDLDREIIAGRVPFPVPFVLGHEFAGEVLACGDAVASIAIGDRVLASFQPSCGACERCL